MSISKIFNSVYAKIFFGSLVGFLAIILGIYVGFAIVGVKSRPGPTPEQLANSFDSLDERYVNFNPGDLFPLENCRDQNGNETNFELLINGQPTIFMFLSTTCGPCHDLLRYWRGGITEMLKSEVQVYICLRMEKSDIPAEYEELYSGFELVFFDGDYWAITYDMSFWPTVVGVDASGFVKHIQFGFENKIDPAIARYYFK
jgi:hypothetical protein